MASGRAGKRRRKQSADHGTARRFGRAVLWRFVCLAVFDLALVWFLPDHPRCDLTGVPAIWWALAPPSLMLTSGAFRQATQGETPAQGADLAVAAPMFLTAIGLIVHSAYRFC